MAEKDEKKKPSKQKGPKGKSKDAQYAAYANQGRHGRNRSRTIQRHLRRFPNDGVARTALAQPGMVRNGAAKVGKKA